MLITIVTYLVALILCCYQFLFDAGNIMYSDVDHMIKHCSNNFEKISESLLISHWIFSANSVATSQRFQLVWCSACVMLCMFDMVSSQSCRRQSYCHSVRQERCGCWQCK